VDAYAQALGAARAGATEAAELSACLAQVAYRQTVVVNHTDSRFLPTDARDRRDLNLVTVRGAGAEGRSGLGAPTALSDPTGHQPVDP